MKKIYVHIGMPKTGTTSIQQNLLEGLMLESKLGYLDHTGRIKVHDYCFSSSAITACILNGEHIESCKSEIQEIIQSDIETFVISNENFSFQHPDFSWGGFSDLAKFNAERIKAVFPSEHFDVSILMFVRSQSTLFPSLYAENHKYISRTHQDFNLWIKDIADSGSNNAPFNYHSIYEKYVSVFSERSVGVLLFEDLQETPDLVYSKFSEYFSVSEDHISKLMSRSKKNATMRSKTGEFATTHKTLNDFVVDLARKLLSPVLSKSLLAIIRSVYSATFAKLLDIRISSSVKMLPSPSDSDIDIVYLMYCESNQAFFESVHLDKAKGIEYGYFL